MFGKFIFISIISLLLIGCGGDNDYDGKNGLISGSSSLGSDIFLKLKTEVFITDAKSFEKRVKDFKKELEIFENNITAQKLQNIQNDFKSLVLSWKRVEATYIAGDYNTTMIDAPLLIDHFHTGNEDIGEQLDRALRISGDLEGLLFKNSSKGITALEYLVFTDSNITKRRVKASIIASSHIIKYASSIREFYEKNREFTADTKRASASLINALIDSSYKLKEWRVGDGAGFTVKYKNQVDATRLEYFKSRQSLEAIKTILKTHQDAMRYFSIFASSNGASKEVLEIDKSLQNALTIANSYTTPLEDAVSEDKTYELYLALQTLHNGYYLSLISALNITSKILEADGD